MRGWRSVLGGACALVVAAGAVVGCGDSGGSSGGGGGGGASSGDEVNVAFVCATPTLAFFGPVREARATPRRSST